MRISRSFPASDESFGRRDRLRRHAEFARVYRQRNIARDEILIVFGRRNTLGHPRLGLSVSRKVGNAVHRNRWKRLIREAFRRGKRDLPVSIDLIVIPQPGDVPPLARIHASLQRLTKKLAQRLPPE